MGKLAMWGAVGGAAKGWQEGIKAEMERQQKEEDYARLERLEALKHENNLNLQRDEQRWGSKERVAAEEAALTLEEAQAFSAEQLEIIKGEQDRQNIRLRGELGIGVTGASATQPKPVKIKIPYETAAGLPGEREAAVIFDPAAAGGEGRYWEIINGRRVDWSVSSRWDGATNDLMQKPETAVDYLTAQVEAGVAAQLPPIFIQTYPEIYQQLIAQLGGAQQ